MKTDWTSVLAGALQAGKANAVAADRPDDGGTCNFDDVFLTAKGKDRRLFVSIVTEALRIAGISSSESTWNFCGSRMKGYFVLEANGQGERRSRMQRAFLDAANHATPSDAPFQFLGYYQMD